ncbi:complement factor H-like [Chelmon rostratus]|uniref:complement factor H-like n=1 Tax=Chelmon rostratus TaxID=109905 RepID=UPI001BEA4826|nr:complement factor H-like [Chelmon rostratus]
MCMRYPGFVLLLVWFPGGLHGQSAALPCPAPTLNGGYFVPEHETYAHETKLTYACENGRKPAAEGWWATSTCQNGKWSHEPQCIDENACIPPQIPNAKYTIRPNGWYEDGQSVRITCEAGYEGKDHDATALCRNGTWTSVPVCKRSTHMCREPPKIRHAVIIHRGYQELFAPDSEVQYECEDGYTVEGGDTKKSIFCMSGTWSDGPACSKRIEPGAGQAGSAEVGTGGGDPTLSARGTQPADRDTRPGTGHGGSTVGATDGRHTSSVGSGTQPTEVPDQVPDMADPQLVEQMDDTLHLLAVGHNLQVDYWIYRGTRPGTGHGGSTVGGNDGRHTSSVGSGTQPADRGTRPGTGHGGSTVGGTDGRHTSSVGSGTQPADRGTRPGTGQGTGSSTTSGSHGRESNPIVMPVSYCGAHPVVPNGVVVQAERSFLKYQCNAFYTQVGLDTVVCHSDGSWSELPICKEAFCVLDPANYRGSNVVIPAVEYLKEGEAKRISCVWHTHSSVFRCTNGRITLTHCCTDYDHRYRRCPLSAAED